MKIHVNDQLNQTAAGTWRLDPARSTITVTAKKLGFFTVPATLTMVTGSIEIDSNHQVTAVEVIAAAGSYASRNDKRNQHVRSADFLDADNHPDLVFRADAVTATAGGYSAAGLLTIKGQTHPLQVEIADVAVAGESGSLRATATVDRHAVGVDKMPSFIVGRDIQLAVEAHADLVVDP